MKHQEDFFTSLTSPSSQIYYQSWIPAEEPKAALIVVHGLGEHSGRYMNLVNHFVPKGFAVYGLDHVGHGRSDGSRVFVERFDQYVETVHQFVGMVSGWLPDTPRFLVGHSMGGLIGTAYLISHQSAVKGAILSGPAVKVPDDVSAVTMTVGKLLSALLPNTGILQLDANHVSRDPAVVRTYVDDPLVYNGKVTARLASEMLKTMRQVTENASQITVPVLVVQGGDDKLVDPSAGPMLVQNVSSVDKTLKMYDGFYHEIFNEPDHLQVMADVEEWLGIQLR